MQRGTLNGTKTGFTGAASRSQSWQVLEERVGSVVKGSYVWSPVYVDAMIARDPDTDGNGSLDERLYAVHDANFNVTALIDTTGAVVERYAYDAFGLVTILTPAWATRTTSSYAWVYLHQGGRWDADSGTYSFRHREYSPTLCRWTTNDPIGFEALDQNLYRGIANSIVVGTDPLGLQGIGATKITLNTPLKDIEESLADGKLGFSFLFNFDTGGDPGRKYFLQAINKVSFGVSAKGRIILGQGAGPDGRSMKIDQLYCGDVRLEKPGIVPDERSLRVTENAQDPVVFWILQTESVAGLSDFISIDGKGNGYRPLVDDKGNDRNNCVVTQKGYDYVRGAVKSKSITFRVTYVYFNPNAVCDADFVLKAIRNFKYDPAVLLKNIPLGKEKFEALDFAELLGSQNPMIKKPVIKKP